MNGIDGVGGLAREHGLTASVDWSALTPPSLNLWGMAGRGGAGPSEARRGPDGDNTQSPYFAHGLILLKFV